LEKKSKTKPKAATQIDLFGQGKNEEVKAKKKKNRRRSKR